MPTLLVSTGTGMLVPVLPVYLRELGLSYTVVTTVLAAIGVGSMVAQIPVGALVARVGERPVMLVALAVLAIAIALLGFAPVTIALVALRVVAGFGSTGWLLSRHSFMTSSIPVDVRGRASSLFGGMSRLGFLIGPLLGGFIAGRWGFEAAFIVTGVTTALGIVPLMVAPDDQGDRPNHEKSQPSSLLTVIREHKRSLVTAGVVQLGVIAVRSGRQAVLPFLGVAVGLDVSEVGLLIAIGVASELLLVPVAGLLMDRFGRLAAVVPSLSLFGVGLLLAAAASTATALIGAGVVMGLGNGLGAGTMLTIGSDLAPQRDPSRFLAVLGTTRDTGRIFGPLLVGWFADNLGLPTSAVVLAMVAFATAAFTAGVLGDTRDGS